MATVAEHRRTTEEWRAIITGLTAKRQGARDHAEQLRAEKRDIALEAALGPGGDAKKRLTAINAELSRLALEADDWDSAITRAESGEQQAKRDADDKAERERQAALGAIARKLINHAATFTGELRSAVESARAVKAAAAEMIALAKTPEERAGFDRLLQPGPSMRAAEHVGLRAHLEFQPFAGRKQDIVPLEDEMKVYLAAWLNSGKENQ